MIDFEDAPEEPTDVLRDSIIESEIIDVLAGTVAVLSDKEDDNDWLFQISSL